MAQRLDLQELLVGLNDGNVKVYFQPPPTLEIEYPCIVYKRDYAVTNFGDNKPYMHKLRYQIIVIDRNPDTLITQKIAALPMCVFDRHYTSDGLNHDVYKLYF